VDEQLVKNMLYAPTDMILGRGTTELLVNGTKHAYKKLKEHCSKGHKECAKKMLDGTVKVGKAIGKGAVVAGKALHKCATNPAKCGKKIGEVGKAIGGAVKDWAVNTWDFAADRIKQSRERKAYCNKSAANKKKCAEEDAIAEANKAKGWAEYRKNNKWAHVAYQPVKHVKTAVKHVKAAGKAVVAAHKKAVQHVAKVTKAVVDVHKQMYKAAKDKLCFWCEEEKKVVKRKKVVKPKLTTRKKATPKPKPKPAADKSCLTDKKKIKYVQETLIKLGQKQIVADGLFGPNTLKALNNEHHNFGRTKCMAAEVYKLAVSKRREMGN
jgi:hypothetical protein